MLMTGQVKHLLLERWLTLAICGVFVSGALFVVAHRVAPVSSGLLGNYHVASGLALAGYDPVAYFTAGMPVEGMRQFTVEWAGVSWRFAGPDDRDLFLTDPQSFAPQFGGYCALAVSKGFVADTSPEAWFIYEKKLYLFRDEKSRAEWIAALSTGSLRAAEANWRERRLAPAWWRVL